MRNEDKNLELAVEILVNYPHLCSLRSLKSGGLSLSGSENDFLKSPTSLEYHKVN